MNDKIKNVTENFFSTPEGKKLASKRDVLEEIAGSADGVRIRDMLSGSDVKQAAEKGDIGKLSAAVQSVLKTEEGARLAKRISELMK